MNWSAGRELSPSRSRMTLLYSRELRRRSCRGLKSESPLGGGSLDPSVLLMSLVVARPMGSPSPRAAHAPSANTAPKKDTDRVRDGFISRGHSREPLTPTTRHKTTRLAPAQGRRPPPMRAERLWRTASAVARALLCSNRLHADLAVGRFGCDERI